MPEVNFNTRAVVIAYQGLKNSSGYGISISEIRREGANLSVKVAEQHPEGDRIAGIPFSPFVAVSIPRPPDGAVIKFEDEVKKSEQNRNLNERTSPADGRNGRRRRG